MSNSTKTPPERHPASTAVTGFTPTVSTNERREIVATLTADGSRFVASGTLTPASRTDPVYITLPPRECLPIVFVPGIMGSNLRRASNKKNKVWRLDGKKPVGLFWEYFDKDAEARQAMLKPHEAEVDDGGAISGTAALVQQRRARGWGEVGQGSYHEFLLWLEEQLNSGRSSKDAHVRQVRALSQTWQPELFGHLLSEQDIKKCLGFRYPVYAVGYNWLDDNAKAAERLASRIKEIINENKNSYSSCEQVILVTHSMGGLVARACARLAGMQDKIAGVIHGVMPAQGAPVAYRRCKVGMWDEVNGIETTAAMVIGVNGSEVTAVFAQAPGALQLLPNQDYPSGWLQVQHQGDTLLRLPKQDPYDEIYKVKDKWWALVSQQTLGKVSWKDYVDNIDLARAFHQETLGRYYHPETYVFYGADPKQKSVEQVRWQLTPDQVASRTVLPVSSVLHSQAYLEGSSNLLRVQPHDGGNWRQVAWGAVCSKPDQPGDGTVPVASGKAPAKTGDPAVRQQFGLSGFAHEPAYHNRHVNEAVLHSIVKVTGRARVPA